MYHALVLLSLLNVIDCALTFIGLKRMLISELNPLMKILWTFSPYSFLMIKMGLSVLLIVIGKYACLVGCRQQWLKGAVVIVCSLYLGVFITHLKWLLYCINSDSWFGF